MRCDPGGRLGCAVLVAFLTLATMVAAVAVVTIRPFSWSARWWSAGVLSQTAGRSNALVSVFISVTIVPAAGDLALSIAGVATLLLQRRIWRAFASHRATSQ